MSKLIEIQTGGHNCFFFGGVDTNFKVRRKENKSCWRSIVPSPQACTTPPEKNDAPLLTPPLIGEFGNWMVLLPEKKKEETKTLFKKHFFFNL
jgi:hypothetical protein